MSLKKQEERRFGSKNRWLALIIIAILILAVYGFNSFRTTNKLPGELDSFAQCLSDQGAKFYGATWCPHCQIQKESFGKSFKYISYVECAMPGGNGISNVCKKDNIEGFPTWTFADGSRETGEQSMEDLAEKTGCELPAVKE